MGPVHFKLSMSDGLTRRISFPTRPSWTDLATRIHALCSIPFSRLAVSYLDSDGDEVTLSSEEELRDFYDSGLDSTIQGNQLIRFHVVELGSHRDMDNFMDATSPQPSSTRNTFGRPAPFVFVDHDHLPFNDLFIPSPLDREMNSDSPHAFVEVIDDDIEKESEPYTDMEDSPFRGKGKARDLRASVSVDVSSSESVIADETPTKPPIHVQVHGLRPMDSGTFGLPHAASTPARETVTPTPTLPIPSSESYIQEVQQDLPGSFPAPFPDPPTPELDAQNDPNISFSHDLASLLDSLNSMFIEHPEVGENLRALLRNAGNGSYWNAQRDSIARVAEDVQRVARDAQSAVACGAQELARGVRQRAQQEAARRVTEAVGNIIRVFGVAAADLPSSNSPDDSAQAPRRPRAPTPPSPPAGVFPFMDEGGTSFYPRAPPAMAIPFQPGGVPPPVGMMPPAPPPPPVGAPVWNQFRPFPGLSSAPPRGGLPS
ncbi:hypothetical protein F5148DRAFT_849991 [Russula earlei]|uniref:Uncharacterized protein n=1 Tax=Russula earlei TaxID=71964 RepID=A0ACC0UN54_9AGAM|nr:hypothetical protein F5148DRAFT_849991 [Russula earlei]